MGFAMLKGWVSALSEIEFHVAEPSPDLRARASQLIVPVYGSADEIDISFDKNPRVSNLENFGWVTTENWRIKKDCVDP